MAAENYVTCLEMILHHEGGYVNHPKDPGGETNLGVTKRVYEDFGGTKDMKDLVREGDANGAEGNRGVVEPTSHLVAQVGVAPGYDVALVSLLEL